jgi:hypothetical protein
MRRLSIALVLGFSGCTVINLKIDGQAGREVDAPQPFDMARPPVADLALPAPVPESPPPDMAAPPDLAPVPPVPTVDMMPPDPNCDWTDNHCCISANDHYCAPDATGQLYYCLWPVNLCKPCGGYQQPCCTGIPGGQQCANDKLICRDNAAGQLVCLFPPP